MIESAWKWREWDLSTSNVEFRICLHTGIQFSVEANDIEFDDAEDEWMNAGEKWKMKESVVDICISIGSKKQSN